jgi:hypothetical protein
MPFSRAEAVCACDNITQLVQDLIQTLPQTYAESVTEKAEGIKQTLLDKPDFDPVTDNMTNALRNIWNGLRRWDHKGLGSTNNILEGLQGVLKELGEPAVETKKRSFKEAITPEDLGYRTPIQQAPVVIQTPSPVPVALTPQVHPDAVLETLGKTQENVISVVRDQVFHSHFKTLMLEDIKYGHIEKIVGKTKSERTKELIMGGYYAGKVAGIALLEAYLVRALEAQK